MKNTRTSLTLGLVLLLAASAPALAQGGPPQKCDGADIANGPFAYSAPSVGQATFNGQGGGPVSTGFTITAPSVDPKLQHDNIQDVFPGQGQEPCSQTAFATISALEVFKVGDANGNLLSDAVQLDTSSGLGLIIASSFSLTPSSYVFSIGETLTVALVVTNPNVAPADYGDYDVKLAAKAPGYGIGVGEGAHFFLSLRPLSATDTTPPVVTVTKPSGDEILGVIPVEVQAYDPNTPPVATGLASMSATVSSTGGTVSNLPISLTLDQALPVAAGVTVIGTGTFTPFGGTGSSGTTDGSAFTSTTRSGIGSYTINAQATDGAGNIGYGSKSFNVKYSVAFTQASAPPPCASAGAGPGANCKGMFQFNTNRSNVTSDGAFMFDHTVVVRLVRTSDQAIMASHAYGTGDIKLFVQIDVTPIYQTHFRRTDFGATAPGTYVAKVYFLDVDNNLILQGTSSAVTF